MYCCAENVIAAPFVQPVYQLMYRFIVARRSSTSQQTLYKNLGFCIRLSGPALLAEALGTYASPAGLVRPPLPRLAYCGLRPQVLQGEVSPCEPLWPAFQLYPRLPKPITHTRPRGIHAPGHSFGVIQTMLLALPNFGLERMGRKNSGGYAGMALLSALRAQNQKPKTKNQKPKTKNQKPKTKRKSSSGRRPQK